MNKSIREDVINRFPHKPPRLATTDSMAAIYTCKKSVIVEIDKSNFFTSKDTALALIFQSVTLIRASKFFSLQISVFTI